MSNKANGIASKCKNCGHSYEVHWSEIHPKGLGLYTYTGCEGDNDDRCYCTRFEAMSDS